MRMLHTRKGKVAIALGALAALSIAGLWILSRESTLIAAVDYMQRKLDGRLAVAQVHGSLLSKIEARGLRYQDKFGTLEIDGARFEWRPLRLLIGQIAVGEVATDNVRLALEKTEDTQRKPPESLAAPLSFAITDFTIGTLSIVQAEGTQEIRGLRAAFAGNRRQLTAEVKSLATQWGDLKGEIEIGSRHPFALEGTVEFAAPNPQDYSVVAKLGGSLIDAEASIDAKARDATAAAKVEVAPYDMQPITRLEFSAQNFDPRAWSPTAPAGKLSGEGRLVADAERRLDGAFSFVNSVPGSIDEKKLPFASISGAMEGTLEALAVNHIKLDLAQAGQLAGTGAWRDRVFQVNFDTRNLNLHGFQKRMHATQLAGRVGFAVDSEKQRVRLNLAQPPYSFRFSGAFADGIARIEEAYARAGTAELTTRGRIALHEEKSFAVAGNLKNFDPSKFGAYPSHQINGRFDAKGHVEPVLQVAANVNVTDSRLSGLPATASGKFTSRRADRPDVEMDVALSVGSTRASAKGIVRDPAGRGSMDMQLTLSGSSLDELYQVIGVPLPPTPPYRISGRLLQKDEQWEFLRFTGAVGDSDLSGDFLIDRARQPQFMKADLKSNRLALADLAGFIGAEKTEEGKVTTPENPARVLPTTPYSLEKLKAADADIRFEGKQIITEHLPVSNMSTHLVLKGGVLSLAPLDFGVAGGKLVSKITLDGRQSPIASQADIRVQSLQLAQLTPKLKASKASVGEMDGRVRLATRGDSIAAMLGSANGDVALLVGEGEVSDLILRLSNLDLANTLLVLMQGDRNVPIRCMVADLAFENGVMRPRQFVFDTAHTTLVGEGKVDFAQEALGLRLVAKPRGNSLMALRGPINVSGTFAKPSVRPDLKQLTARGAAAVALSVVTPVAGVVPFLQFGRNQDVECGPLIQQARQTIEQPAAMQVARR